MGRAAKLGITLDEDLLERVDQMRRRTGESRSALLARALRALVTDEDHRREVQRYVAAYSENPETDEEIEVARQQSRRALAHLK